VTLATSVQILVFLGLSVLGLGPMYMTDVRQKALLNAPAYYGQGHNKWYLAGTLDQQEVTKQPWLNGYGTGFKARHFFKPLKFKEQALSCKNV